MKATDEQKTAFLGALEATGRIMESCRAAGITYGALDGARRKDGDFDKAVGLARRAHGEKWEKACFDRGIDGWLEPRFHDGKECGTVRRFSDRCLELGLKRHCPEYREKMQIDATIQGEVGVLVVGAPMTEEEWVEKYGGEKKAAE